ncbi:hypothetical protein JIN77_11510 [Verrucomicrobiaceae bacterium R5-34]|uniref:Transporter n=1 Tax=Oceaniferula flava TaxID=2800421 RepID=A0AAE2SAS1_9BACT|nr:hypothetical protein [Oceaniferula flavus]MBK1831357.1 hypothetical protein [Verrucomicrobiaceae bacterium R5-34]MBK1854973.1 hypothetical protein [Oceaniferula flavus]MBM1136279.1 hypothetical protein [Oceaniferula flavus]
MKTRLVSLVSLVLASNAFAHHGQDFLVTLDTATPHAGQIYSTTGFDYSKHGGEEETAILQAFSIGLPAGFTLGASYQISNEGDSEWAAQSFTPTLQWNAPSYTWGQHSSLSLGIAIGWEIPTEGEDSDHSHSDSLELTDCSSLIGIPALYQACQLANEQRANHTHGDEHSHDGIHRHGESHGFVRLIAQLELGHHDQIAANLIAVFPEDDSPAYGYAIAYRHRFSDFLAAGIEATGDFDRHGEHLLYLTTTLYPNEKASITFGAAAGLTEAASDFALQTLFTWRF